MQDESTQQNILACAWTKGSAHRAGGISVELGRVQINRETGEAKWYCSPEEGRGGGIMWETQARITVGCLQHLLLTFKSDWLHFLHTLGQCQVV